MGSKILLVRVVLSLGDQVVFHHAPGIVEGLEITRNTTVHCVQPYVVTVKVFDWFSLQLTNL